MQEWGLGLKSPSISPLNFEELEYAEYKFFLTALGMPGHSVQNEIGRAVWAVKLQLVPTGSAMPQSKPTLTPG